MAGDETLPAKAGVDAHHQNQIDIVDQIVQRLGRSGRVQRDAGLLAQRADQLDRAVHMRAGFGMHGDDIGSRCGKGFDIDIDRADHQMDVERLGGVRAQRLHHHRPDREVGHEMPVHHIDMDPVRPGCVNRPHLFAQPREVGRENRRRDKRHGHDWNQSLSRRVRQRRPMPQPGGAPFSTPLGKARAREIAPADHAGLICPGGAATVGPNQE